MIHKDLAKGRWHTLALAEQLGNAGSEFLRAKKRPEALARFIELMDLTISDPRWLGERKQELARVKEVALEELQVESSDQTLQKYFDQFAFLARK